jgi:hypothetical protein
VEMAFGENGNRTFFVFGGNGQYYFGGNGKLPFLLKYLISEIGSKYHIASTHFVVWPIDYRQTYSILKCLFFRKTVIAHHT